MDNLEERFDLLKQKINSPKFRENTGLGKKSVIISLTILPKRNYMSENRSTVYINKAQTVAMNTK